MQLDFWLSAHNLGDKAHIMVPPHKIQVVTKYLKIAGLLIEEFVGDVGRYLVFLFMRSLGIVHFLREKTDKFTLF